MIKNEVRSELFLRYIQNIKDNIVVVIEDNYIDKVYRNIFSNYLSTKLNAYEQRCLRISFFKQDFDLSEILDNPSFPEIIIENYLGFMIIRPIVPGLVGRTAISPEALAYGDDINVLRAPIRTSFLGIKLVVEAFPLSSQDSEYATCAETSIWAVMEYFGNKYPEYTPILPSFIHKELDRNSYQRHIPSSGLVYTDISLVLQSFGFGCKIYCLETPEFPGYDKDELHRIFSSYVDSGVPMIAAIGMDSSEGHAIVCVGKEKTDRNLIETCKVYTTPFDNKRIRIWADVKMNFIFNDDNSNCYVCADYDCPTPQYKDEKPYISSIIVPLYRKVYLDAPRALELSIALLDEEPFFFKEEMAIRTFLASGRTYLDYLMRDPILDVSTKAAIIDFVSFPKFIWITEISSLDDFKQHKVEGLLILDATEPMEYTVGYPLLACFDDKMHYFCPKTSMLKKYCLNLQFKSISFENYK